MAGVSDANSQENLLTWTMRHEIGHSVDAQIGWEKNFSKNKIFGEWEKHSELDVFKVFLKKEGVKDDIQNFEFKLNREGKDGLGKKEIFLWELIKSQYDQKGKNFSSIYDGMKKFIEQSSIDLFNKTHDCKKVYKQAKKAIRLFEIAKNHPWMFNDGGRKDLEYQGRIYMMRRHYDDWDWDYDDWESYNISARKYAVSNYQFSNVAEWFAEAYAAYYNPKEKAKSRQRLSSEQRDWFEKNLGTYKGHKHFNRKDGRWGQIRVSRYRLAKP